MCHPVSVRDEIIYLPTYPVGKPEKNPVFLEKRVYQGSSGVVYPHPVIESVGGEKQDQPYRALFLENEFIEIMILPELGGRVHRAYDKIRKRDFVYYNSVIKPALVGLTGPWISGGIEFNWPQHHRPSTFQPVDYTITENEDGSKTVWINEVELMFRTKCQAGFTLYPGKAYLEVKAKLYNRTPFPQTFLWWTNPAVKVNEHYQSVFPPDVHAVFDHGKRDVSEFPIAKGTYYNVDYAPGTDISRYSNIPVPTSYMAIRSDYDFIGGYEHDTQAGMLHVANHHVSPGKKQWTWGCGDFGRAWDRNLTDDDGPYIELMTGMFTDNQPDFSWLQPNEEKTFEQYFMPYAGVGLVKNATREAMMNVENVEGGIRVIVYATALYRDCSIQVLDAAGSMVFNIQTELSPKAAFETTIAGLQPAQELTFRVLDANGSCLVDCAPLPSTKAEIPEPASPAKAPSEIEKVEDLFLNGLHLEQYRHATYQPMDYYKEGLRRSPGDIRCNNAAGLWLLRHGQFEKAIPYFKKAIETSTNRNPNPYDGEPYYNLGLCLMLMGRHAEAYNHLYKATWNDAWQHNGFLQLARIDLAKGDLAQALYHCEKSLVKNYHSHNARHLKATILRKLSRHAEAIAFIEESLQIDPFGFGCLYEAHLNSKTLNLEQQSGEYLQKLQQLSRGAANNYLEYAIDYGHAGCFDEAVSLLQLCPATANPMLHYFLAYFTGRQGNVQQSELWLASAANCSPNYCFPNKLEEMLALQFAVETHKGDGLAWYYLGNFWYGMRQYDEAIEAFEQSVAINPQFPTAQRNLALLYYNKRNDVQKAQQLLENAFALDKTDARVLMELDQLYEKTNRLPAERLALLEQHLPLVNTRDDLYTERIWLLNCLGRVEEADALLMARRFNPWEGGEGKVVGQYLHSRYMLALKALQQQDGARAYGQLESAKNYPHNLGEGKLFGAQENDIHYLQGAALSMQGRIEEAENLYRLATVGNSEPKAALFYNDPQPDKILYQGLAWLKLGEHERAAAIFNKLIAYGRQHMNDEVQIDYFAVSLPDVLVFDKNLDHRNQVHCTYLLGLGELGLGNYDNARKHLNNVLNLEANHLGAIRHLLLADWLEVSEKHMIKDMGANLHETWANIQS